MVGVTAALDVEPEEWPEIKALATYEWIQKLVFLHNLTYIHRGVCTIYLHIYLYFPLIILFFSSMYVYVYTHPNVFTNTHTHPNTPKHMHTHSHTRSLARTNSLTHPPTNTHSHRKLVRRPPSPDLVFGQMMAPPTSSSSSSAARTCVNAEDMLHCFHDTGSPVTSELSPITVSHALPAASCV